MGNTWGPAHYSFFGAANKKALNIPSQITSFRVSFEDLFTRQSASWIFNESYLCIKIVFVFKILKLLIKFLYLDFIYLSFTGCSENIVKEYSAHL